MSDEPKDLEAGEETSAAESDPFVREVDKKVSEMNFVELCYMDSVLGDYLNFMCRKSPGVWNKSNPHNAQYVSIASEKSAIQKRMRQLRPAFMKNKRSINLPYEDKYRIRRLISNRYSIPIATDAYTRMIAKSDSDNGYANEGLEGVIDKIFENQKEAAIAYAKKEKERVRREAKGFERLVYKLNDFAQSIVDFVEDRC